MCLYVHMTFFPHIYHIGIRVSMCEFKYKQATVTVINNNVLIFISHFQ